MRHSVLASSVLVGLALALSACGGSSSSKDAKSASSAKADLSAMDELKAIPGDLNADVDDLMKPINDSQEVSDQITSMPSRLGISAKDMKVLVQATLDNGTVDLSASANLKVGDDAKAEIQATLTKLKGIVDGLKATPDKVTALTQKIVTVSAKVPVLATKVTTEAQVAVSNPFGGADAKAKAQANIDGVKQIQADVQKSVSDAQAKVAGVPAMATSALTKLTASFTGKGGKSAK